MSAPKAENGFAGDRIVSSSALRRNIRRRNASNFNMRKIGGNLGLERPSRLTTGSFLTSPPLAGRGRIALAIRVSGTHRALAFFQICGGSPHPNPTPTLSPRRAGRGSYFQSSLLAGGREQVAAAAD